MSPAGGDSVAKLRGDVSAHAKSITEIVINQREINDRLFDLDKDNAVRVALDRALDDRLKRIETSIEDIRGLGKWLLAAVGAGMVTAVVTFIVHGGLNVGH